MKLGFSRQIFEKYSKKIYPLGAEVFHADGHTDSRVESNSRFSQFFEGA
jgi:hypothetical protein